MKRTGIKNREKEKNKSLPSLTKPTIFFILLVLIGIIGMIIVVFYVDHVTSLEFKENVYQYYLTSFNEHKPGTTISDQNMSIILNDSDKNYSVDSTPFYSESEDKFYIPKSYSWFNPSVNWAWRVPEFTSIKKVGHGTTTFDCQLNQKEYQISGGILLDELSNYIFLEAGTVTINNKTYNVSPLSFFSQDYDVTRLYDYDTKDFIYVEDNLKSAIYKSVVGYSVDLRKGIYTSIQGEQTLITGSPSLLENIEKRG